MISSKRCRLVAVALMVLWAASLQAGENPTPTVPQVAVPPLSIGQYVADLDRYSSAVNDLPSHPEKSAQLRAALPKNWTVQTSTGVMTVSTAWLDDLLRRWGDETNNRGDIQQRIQKDLAAMRQQAQESQLPAKVASDSAAQAKLKEILSRREFRSVEGPTWWDEMWEKFWNWLDRMWDKVFGRVHVSRNVGSTISWTLISFAFLVVVWLIARNLLAQSRGLLLHLEAPVRTHGSSREWADAALQAANAGDFREAIHCAYWAAVYRLDEAGVWTLDATRTPREYLRLLKAEVPQRPAMSEITRNFEVVWYGKKPASEREFRMAVDGLEKLGCHLPWAAAIENS
jgi:Domain of unknown function (DUF4129)